MIPASNYAAISPDLAARYFAFSSAVAAGAIEAPLRQLIEIRASQINGCAFCLDLHVKQARMAGERELRLHHLALWRDSPLFSAREKAALAWTEALTDLSHGAPTAADHAAASAELSEKDLTDLSFAITSINGWNRISIAFGTVAGSMDARFGLTDAGLV
jgi:AhpD family alkylhydroperoxidase